MKALPIPDLFSERLEQALLSAGDFEFSAKFAFNEFVLDSGSRCLLQDGSAVALTPKEFQALLMLVQADGRAIPRETLVETIWPDTAVGDTSLGRIISVLRRHLGTDAIASVARFGYRFTLPVRQLQRVEDLSPATTNVLPSPLGSLTSKPLSGLIERIYAASSDPASWPSVLTEIGLAVSEGTQTILFLPSNKHLPAVLRCDRVPDSVLIPFLEYFNSVNVLAEPCDLMFADGDVRLSHLAVQDSEFERSEFYTDFFRPNDLFYSCGIKQKAPDGVAYLSLQREKSLQPFSKAETAVLPLLMPHIRQSLQIQARLTALHNHLQTTEMALNIFGKAVVALDATGQVRFATDEAELILRSGTALSVSAGRLYARDTAINERLQQKIHNVLALNAGFISSPEEALLIPLPSANSLKLILVPMRYTGLLGSHTHGAIVTISGGFSPQPDSSFATIIVLQQLFNLTPTQARIADLLAAGADVKLIASLLARTEDVVRFHLKQVFAKTGTRSQSQLVRLLSDLPKRRSTPPSQG